MNANLELTSSDKMKFELNSKAGERSGLLKNLISDYEESKDIPLPDIKGEILKKIVDYLTHYKDIEPKEIPKPLPTANLGEFLDEWDISFINGIELEKVFDLINASNYMDIKPLLDLSCAKIASLMKGKTAEEIRAMFNIECDLSPEELREYEEYQL